MQRESNHDQEYRKNQTMIRIQEYTKSKVKPQSGVYKVKGQTTIRTIRITYHHNIEYRIGPKNGI